MRERALKRRSNIQQIEYADMAQEVEHVLGKDEVAGSNPAISSSEKPQDIVVFLRISGLKPQRRKNRKNSSKHNSKHFRRFFVRDRYWARKAEKNIFRTVKNAMKLPFSGAVANNSKQSFRRVIKQPSCDGCFMIKIYLFDFGRSPSIAFISSSREETLYSPSSREMFCSNSLPLFSLFSPATAAEGFSAGCGAGTGSLGA